jgi:hypothetical protein
MYIYIPKIINLNAIYLPKILRPTPIYAPIHIVCTIIFIFICTLTFLFSSTVYDVGAELFTGVYPLSDIIAIPL